MRPQAIGERPVDQCGTFTTEITINKNIFRKNKTRMRFRPFSETKALFLRKFTNLKTVNLGVN